MDRGVDSTAYPDLGPRLKKEQSLYLYGML
jgi:hypothetical protein